VNQPSSGSRRMKAPKEWCSATNRSNRGSLRCVRFFLRLSLRSLSRRRLGEGGCIRRPFFCVLCAHARNASRSDAGGSFAAIPVHLTSAIVCSITYTLLSPTNQTPVQPLPISYVNNVPNWLKRIRAAIRYDKSRVASASNLPISLRSSGVWNLRPVKSPPSLLPMNWVLIRICFWRWPAKSLPNFKPSFVNAQNYSLT
jgi:hypothetical protein